MKKNITLFTLLFVSFIFQAQTTFTFNGSGNWTDEMQWMDNNYPGTTIGADDLVLIEGDLIFLMT